MREGVPGGVRARGRARAEPCHSHSLTVTIACRCRCRCLRYLALASLAEGAQKDPRKRIAFACVQLSQRSPNHALAVRVTTSRKASAGYQPCASASGKGLSLQIARKLTLPAIGPMPQLPRGGSACRIALSHRTVSLAQAGVFR